MCDAIIEAGREGKTVAEMAAEIGITRETFNQWRKDKPEFSDAVKIGLDMAQGWWEGLGRKGAAGMSEINPTVFIFNMKNRFREDWRDKHDHEYSGTVNVTAVERTIVKADNSNR